MAFGESITIGDLLYVKSDGAVWKANAGTTGSYPASCLALETGSTGSHLVLLHGIYRDDSRYAFNVGGIVYLSTTSGVETQTQPSGTANAIQIMGLALTADIIYFKPDLTYITHV